ncbi:carboxylesterase family protein [Streptomyces mirabilis]|uniref:carboxylesterase family protein n=1 Tax=Streptomyces mirabilis TaxID=68239 RepID=UPI0033B09D2E
MQIADHHAAGGNATYVYQFDYHPAQDPDRLGPAHCVELPFLFGTFDNYPDSPMVGTPSDTERALGRSLATAVSAFVATGSASDWLPYAPAATARIRDFSRSSS